MKYLLDTDTCIYALKQHESILQRLLSTAREDVAISVITEAELRTGAARSSSPIKALRLIENFLRPLTSVDFTSHDAIAYATVRAKLERAGTPIGPLDTLIASQAVTRRLVLVTNNEREFRRVTVSISKTGRADSGSEHGGSILVQYSQPDC
jgi:tRNA(fMet)-specific endonuclease VapC